MASSPRYEGSPEPPSLRVQRLESSGAGSECVVMAKLTDEIFAALMNASKKNSGKLQVRVDSKGGTFDLGPHGIFHFQSQLLNGETDTICEDAATQRCRMTGSFRTKYQIQATDKSFAETKEKTQKLIKEEKSRRTKEYIPINKRKAQVIIPTPPASRLGSDDNGKSKSISPFVQRNVTSMSPSILADLAGYTPTTNINKRTAHIPNTAQPSLKRSRQESASAPEDPTISQVNHHSPVSPKISERIVTAPKISTLSKRSPKRSGGGSSSASSRLSSPQNPSCEWEKNFPEVQLKSFKKTPMSPTMLTDLTECNPTTHKNKKTAQLSSKGPQKESVSPSEDPIISLVNPAPLKTTERIAPKMSPKRSPKKSGGGSSSASSRLSSPCSLSSPQNPSCGWEKKFPEIKTIGEAERYFNIFHGDYPSYMEAYRHLHETALEFQEYDKKIKKAGRNTKEVAEIEREVQSRYAHFEKNEPFLRHRQAHADLRSKLSILKQRITEWERAQDNNQSIF